MPGWVVSDDLRTRALIDVFPDQGHRDGLHLGGLAALPEPGHMPLNTRAAVDFFKSRLRSIDDT